MNKPEYVVIHHSATEQGDVAAFRRYHKSLGWRDIGYHYVVNNGTYQRDGFIEKGRPESENGAHAINYNSKSIGICLVGNFDKDKPTSAQMTSLIKLTKDIIKRYKIPIKNVLGHRETGTPKTCPGKNFDMKGFRLSLKEELKVSKKDYKGHWAESSIKKAESKGIMSGFPDDTWKPNKEVSRAELAAILDRLGLLD